MGALFDRVAGKVALERRLEEIRLDEIIGLQAMRLRECLEKNKSYRPFVGRY